MFGIYHLNHFKDEQLAGSTLLYGTPSAVVRSAFRIRRSQYFYDCGGLLFDLGRGPRTRAIPSK
jgi:hypothetical protein